MKDVVFIGCGVLGIVALMVGTDILEEVVFKKMSSISATVRNQWNNRAIESFYSSPLIGVGYKQSRASSIIEDGDKAESNSIGNQRELIRDFAAERPGLHLVEEYADDGYTGTNFERPGFKRMIRGRRLC